MSNLSLLSQDIWATLASESAKSTGMTAAVAYVTNVDELQFRANDTLVLDASPASIQSGKTSALVVERLFDKGVLLYSCPNLHAKIYAFGSSVVVGSPNLSSSSRSTLIECAILSRSPLLVVEARNWIEQLASRSIQIDRDYVNQIKSIAVEPVVPPQEKTGLTGLWYLKTAPNALSNNMRAYFLALIIAQLGTVQAERAFRLWPGADFRQHKKEGRLQQVGDRYVLTPRGVDYFSLPKQRAKDDLLQLFVVAVRTGNGADLPVDETRMLRLSEV